ncbi:MAG TPA: efflux RND transporter periplasmic adaptor subunit [Steroidobacteraceae bacterium]|nr:efflux RND transporter periplasmic adaptor subunit [Steroidobacteraceae bacterium]HQZ80884.1 efflux RND transporter periplasmic adaptor subunit [Steroidobacteraceae bacterium]
MSRFFPACATALFIVAGALLVSCGDAKAPQGPAAQPVTVVTLKSGPVTLTRELPARVNPYLIAEVRPQASGIIEKRLFTEGGAVKASQPLYQLDDSSYRAAYASAQASLARAEATLNSARLNAQRSAELAKVDAVSQQDDEDATAALLQAEADVKLAQANVRSSGIALGYARIVSPINGRIGKSSVTQGALVTANQAEPLATVQQLDPIYVDATASSTELLALRRELAAGTLSSAARTVPVSIVLEDGTTFAHDGKLTFADVTVDPSTGTFLLRVLVPNPEHLLLPGMYVRAVVSVGIREHAVLVPQQGVAHDPKGKTTAMVVGKDGKAELREVQVSHTVGDQWLVDGGLTAGDRVIVEGLQKIRPGSPVQATEAQG